MEGDRRGSGGEFSEDLKKDKSEKYESDDTSEHGSETVDIFPFVRLVTSTT